MKPAPAPDQRDRLWRDLVLLTVTFDPARDIPERLGQYASRWTADPKTWHVLTGTAAEVEQVCGMFGADFFADEGLMSDSVRTAIIDRSARRPHRQHRGEPVHGSAAGGSGGHGAQPRK